MRGFRMQRSSWIAIVLAVLVVACRSTGTSPTDLAPAPPVDALVPGEMPERATWAPDTLARIAALEADGRTALAARAARREQALVRAVVLSGEGVTHNERRWLAAALDRAVGYGPGYAGWRAWIDDAHDYPDRFRRFEDVREACRLDLAAGDPGAALSRLPVPVPSDARSAALLRSQAAATTGTVRLRAGDRGGAAQAFDAAYRATAPQDVFARARFALLAARETGDGERWKAAVREAAIGETFDPDFWAAARESRAQGVAWPDEARDFARRVVSPEADEWMDGDAAIRGLEGVQRRIQGDSVGALTALLAAEEAAGDAATRSRLRVEQARCLLALGRPGDANARLLEPAASDDPAEARPALAMLGALELELGRTDRARVFLDAALEDSDWPGATSALANLGVAQLMEGESEDGVASLRAARSRFRAGGELEDVGRCLRNELQQAALSRDDDQVRALEAELAQWGRSESR